MVSVGRGQALPKTPRATGIGLVLERPNPFPFTACVDGEAKSLVELGQLAPVLDLLRAQEGGLSEVGEALSCVSIGLAQQHAHPKVDLRIIGPVLDGGRVVTERGVAVSFGVGFLRTRERAAGQVCAGLETDIPWKKSVRGARRFRGQGKVRDLAFP
jgi:hypothetical protein